MSRPLFAVGEVVGLVSTLRPEVSGPAKVLGISLHGRCSRPNCSTRYSYTLTIPTVTSRNCWCESSLRKRPKAGDSFSSVMDGLKEKIPA